LIILVIKSVLKCFYPRTYFLSDLLIIELFTFSAIIKLFQEESRPLHPPLYPNIKASCDGLGHNTEYVRRLMPGAQEVLVNLSCRTQLFYVRINNEKTIRGRRDIGRQNIRILNRRPGSGAHIMLDVQLKKLGIDPRNDYRDLGKIVAEV